MGDWQMKKECWPDPKAMVDELRGMGIELMVTFWPFMGAPHSDTQRYTQ
jgi:alpha-D-xyloside xylohydrolase